MGLFVVVLMGALTSSPPLILEGEESREPHRGFEYIPITDENLEPLFSLDGSILYQGMKRLENDQRIRVVQSFKTLKKMGRLKDYRQDPLWRSNWLEDAFQIDVSHYQIERLLTELQNNEAFLRQFFQGMTARKYQVIRQFLFEKNLEVTARDFKDLQRSALNPNPKPIVVPLNFPDKLWGAWNMEMDIQLERIRFEIDEKKVFFHPEDNAFEILLHVRRATLRGPAHERGFIEGTRIEEMPRFLKWDRRSYVEYGAVRGVDIRVKFQFVEDHGFWRIDVPKNGFSIDFLQEEPKVALILNRGFEPLTKTMIEELVEEYFSSSEPPPPAASLVQEMQRRGWGNYASSVFIDEVSVSENTQTIIRRTLAEAIRSSLRTRFFADSLGFQIPLPSPHGSKQMGMGQTRLSDLRITSNGLRLGFDVAVEAFFGPPCAPDFLEPVQKELLRARKSRAMTRSQKGKTSWSLIQNDRWKLSPSTPSTRGLRLRLRETGLDWLLTALWLRGSFCFSSESWWPRPSSIPPSTFSLRRPPQLNWLSKEEVNIMIQGELETRSFYDNAGRSTKEINLEWPLEFDSVSSEIALLSPKLALPSLTIEQNQFLQNLLSWGTSGEALRSVNLLEEAKRHLPEGLHPNQLEWSPQGLALDLPLQNTPITQLKSFSLKEEAPTKVLDTIVIPFYQDETRDWPVELRWQARSGSETQVFYSWRFRSEGGVWSKWSPVEDRQTAKLPLVAAGVYEVEVRAISRWYEIESEPATYRFEYKEAKETKAEPEKALENKNSEVSETRKTPKAAPKDKSDVDTKAVNSAKPGFMGCHLRPDTDGAIPSLLWLLVLGATCWFRQRSTSV